MRQLITTALFASIIATVLVIPANAKRCDGFHGCRCGVTAARLHGLPLDYHGLNLKLAASYYQFPRTSCHAGAVGIPHAHHVYTVERCNGDGTALVHDDAGTYTRRVAGNVFVDPNGNVAGRVPSSVRTYAARSHHRHRHAHYAMSYYAQPSYMTQMSNY